MATGRTWLAGVDGCPAGWLVVLCERDGLDAPRVRVAFTFAEVLALPEQPEVIAVDIPIGLPDMGGIGGRAPDIAARAVLGQRQSAVFAVPARAAVLEADYRAACAVAEAHSDPPRKVSKQTYNLFPKIREVDALMTPALQQRVFECHPEAAFWAMAGERALAMPKKVKSRPHPPGLELRRGLLATAGFPRPFLESVHVPRSVAGADDVLDACACAVTASRIAAGVARRFPHEPPLDARGLRQEIWA